MTIRRRLAYAGTVLIAAVALLSPVTPAAASTPTLASHSGHLRLGQEDQLFGSGLNPGGSYTVSTDQGVLHIDNPVTADSAGSFEAEYLITADTALTSVRLTLSAAGDQNGLATLELVIDPALLSLFSPAGVCSGNELLVEGYGLPEGYYLLSTNEGTLDHTRVQVAEGQLPAVQLTVGADPPDQTVLTATAESSGIEAAEVTKALGPASISTRQISPITMQLVATCFRAGEQVSLTLPPGVTGPATVTVPQTTQLAVDVQLRLGTQPTHLGTVTMTGQNSKLVASLDLGIAPGSTLLAGQSMRDGDRLAAANGSYLSFDQGELTRYIQTTKGLRFERAGGTSTPFANTQLRLQADGNLLVYSYNSNKVLWSTGTSGTGSKNRLVMQPAGDPLLLNSAGQLLWSSDHGLVRVAGGLLSGVSTASFRKGIAVYFSAYFWHRSTAFQYASDPHRTAYLQRYVSGHWQNVLSRVTDAGGNTFVGVVPTKAYQYRWVMPGNGVVATAISKSVIH